MFLYHGTSASAVPSILKDGIKPRKDTGIEPNTDEFEYQGHPECVYLSNAYASYFAAQAASSEEEDDDDYDDLQEAAILEIDTTLLNKKLFLPDDDVLTQWMACQPENSSLTYEDIAATARDGMFAYNHNDAWKVSLAAMGTCAYHGIIPPHAIKRVTFVDFGKLNPEILFSSTDISVTIPAFRSGATKYKMLDAWFWGGKVEYGYGMLTKDQIKQNNAHAKIFETIWQDRSGVRIEKCPGYKKRSNSL